MWKRFRRRSFAPRRPALLPEDLGLVLVTFLAIGVGIAIVAVVLIR
jgi:hypothetical protein